MKDLISNIFQGAKVVDNFTESSDERQKTLTERQKIDMSSDNWLSKSVRPISLLALLTVVCIMALLSSVGFHADAAIFGELSLLLGAAFGFYFDSRKREKIAAKNADANIELEKIKAKHDIKEERKEARQDRRNARRAERTQDKED